MSANHGDYSSWLQRHAYKATWLTLGILVLLAIGDRI
jgi:hypothetical protein